MRPVILVLLFACVVAVARAEGQAPAIPDFQPLDRALVKKLAEDYAKKKLEEEAASRPVRISEWVGWWREIWMALMIAGGQRRSAKGIRWRGQSGR